MERAYDECSKAYLHFSACLAIKGEVDIEFTRDPGSPQVKSDFDVAAKKLSESADAYHRAAKRYAELQRAAARRS